MYAPYGHWTAPVSPYAPPFIPTTPAGMTIPTPQSGYYAPVQDPHAAAAMSQYYANTQARQHWKTVKKEVEQKIKEAEEQEKEEAARKAQQAALHAFWATPMQKCRTGNTDGSPKVVSISRLGNQTVANARN